MKFLSLLTLTAFFVLASHQPANAGSTAPELSFESKSTKTLFESVQVKDSQFRADVASLLDLKGYAPALSCTFSLLKNVAGSSGFVGTSAVHMLVGRCTLNRSGGPTYRSAGFYIQLDSWLPKTEGPYYTKKFLNF